MLLLPVCLQLLVIPQSHKDGNSFLFVQIIMANILGFIDHSIQRVADNFSGRPSDTLLPRRHLRMDYVCFFGTSLLLVAIFFSKGFLVPPHLLMRYHMVKEELWDCQESWQPGTGLPLLEQFILFICLNNHELVQCLQPVPTFFLLKSSSGSQKEAGRVQVPMCLFMLLLVYGCVVDLALWERVLTAHRQVDVVCFHIGMEMIQRWNYNMCTLPASENRQVTHSSRRGTPGVGFLFYLH